MTGMVGLRMPSLSTARGAGCVTPRSATPARNRPSLHGGRRASGRGGSGFVWPQKIDTWGLARAHCCGYSNLMTTTNTKRIEKAAKIMGKAIAKLAKDDPELARKISDAVAAAVRG